MAALLALLASALWGTADFLGGTATRRLPVTSVLGISQLVALLGLVPVAVGLGALSADRAYVLPGVLAGLAGVVALAAFYRALATGTMGVVAPVASLGVIVPVGVGLARGERPGALQVAGIVLAVAGVVLASGPELSGRGRGGAVPLLLAGVAALGFGTVLVLIAAGSAEGSTGAVVMLLLTMRLTAVVVLAVLLLVVSRSRGVGLSVRRRDLPVLVVIGVCDVAANAAYAIASQSDLISVAAVLASLYPVVTVLLARQFHAERLARLQQVGVGSVLAGVLLLAGG